MSEVVADTKREPDLLGIGDCARAINRDVSTTRNYVHALYAQRHPGVFRLSNGLFALRPNVIPTLQKALRGTK